jgi:hypothetical protein
MFQRNMIYMTIAMAIVYIAIGIMFALTHVFANNIPYNRRVIGSVFLLYGTFRLITGIMKLKKYRSESE